MMITLWLVIAGFAQMHFYGVEGDFNVMVMDILGPSLFKLFEFCGNKYTLKTVCMIGIQMIERLETLHGKGFIHRDIKPENFCMGPMNTSAFSRRSHTLYLIDFGLAKRYIDPQTGNHSTFKENRGLFGTARYASVNAHLGNEQSRRDDLEALGYILCFFLR
jgi:casein kinase 1